MLQEKASKRKGSNLGGSVLKEAEGKEEIDIDAIYKNVRVFVADLVGTNEFGAIDAAVFLQFLDAELLLDGFDPLVGI